MKITNYLQLKDKIRRLTKLERSQFSLPSDLRDILIGLFLGDICAQKRSVKCNTLLRFEQGLVHKEYIDHLYDLFKSYCQSVPKTSRRLPDKKTGNVYTRIQFLTYSLPCFTEFYNLFYVEGKKVVPVNIFDLLTPLGLAYWIADDGCFCKRDRRMILATNSFTLVEVNLLAKSLADKFNLVCSINKQHSGYVIIISAKSIPVLQDLLKNVMPSMMRYKIGL